VSAFARITAAAQASDAAADNGDTANARSARNLAAIKSRSCAMLANRDALVGEIHVGVLADPRRG
jgi:hypothetical protein